jgi:photosystem II stability/assembly factor-like uncharacterized protein
MLMSDELRRLLRSAAPQPSELDIEGVKGRAGAMRRRRRAGQLSLLGVAVVAAALTVGTLLPSDGEVVVEPVPTPTAATSVSPSPQDEGPADTGPCEGDRRLVAEWLPEGFSSELQPGTASGGGPAQGVWYWDGGTAGHIEVHVGDRPPYALAPESVSDAGLLQREAVVGPVHEGFMLAWPEADRPDPEEVCGIVAVVGFGIEERQLFGVGENLRIEEPGASASVLVRDAGLLDFGSGWATTSEGVVRTLDGGLGGWWLATPEDADPGRLRGTSFVDHTHGWTLELPAEDEDGVRAQVWRTTDGGTSWEASAIELPPPPFGTYGRVHIDFLDQERGWLLVSFGGNATADQGGALFATDDGGQTWRPLDTPPASAALDLTGPDTAWVVSGPTGGPTGLYVTRDGGGSWQETTVPLPEGWEPAATTHGAPAFWTADSGALPVRLHTGDDTAAMAVYTTGDAGRTWELDDLTEGSTTVGGGLPAAFDLMGPNSWVIAAPDGSRFRVRDDLGIRDLRPASDRLPGPLLDLSAPDQNRVWVLTLPAEGGCTVGAEVCLGLHVPANGRWGPARPIGGSPPSGCAVDAERRNASPDDDPSTLDLYFSCADDGVSWPPPVYRIVRTAPDDADTPAELLRAALETWLAGPDDTQRDRGYSVSLWHDQGELLAGVSIDTSGVATVDFTTAFSELGNVNTSHASAVFHRQLLATVFAAPDVDAVRFTIDGDCEAFSHYFEGSDCRLYKPAEHGPPIGTREP